MKSDHVEYNLKDSVKRIKQIITLADNNYEELERIPHRNDLTYMNGFYVKCSALFIDIREPLELTDLYKSKDLAKLYRAYISEVTAVINGNPKCSEINVVGDFISGFFDTPFQEDVDEVFTTAAKISSIVDIINYQFKKNGMNEIKIGIGISYGKALLVKTGYKGSGVSEVIWVGEVVKEASKLASYGNKESVDKEIMVSEIFYYNLSLDNQKLLVLNADRNCYNGDIVNSYMNNWYKQNCL